jgi:hypothetical protein
VVSSKEVKLISEFNPTWEDLAADWGKPIQRLKPVLPDEE